jgi:hypothetical protein
MHECDGTIVAQVALMSYFFLALYAALSVLPAVAKESQVDPRSRFRPFLEVPSFYVLKSEDAGYWIRHRDQLESRKWNISTAYQALDDQNFDQHEFIEGLVNETASDLRVCKGDQRLSRQCRIEAATLTLAGLRKNTLIDDVAYGLIVNSVRLGDEAGSAPITSVQKYWNKLRSLGALSEYDFSDNPYQASKFNSKLTKNEVSARQRLYYTYTFLQIDAMGRLFDTLLKRMNGEMSIVVDYDHDGIVDETIKLSEGEAETHAKALFERLKERARAGTLLPDSERDASPYLVGLNFTNTDLILAAVETGRLPRNILSMIVNDPELNDPRNRGLKKILQIGKRVATAAVLANPLLAGYSSLAVIVWQTFEEVKSAKKQTSSDHLH